ncbi:hypothetical protein B0H63DRAFT_561393 [Podospora didyma]|uniref:F-box domain-containing protein n=1 Tax=Podospora didyma TaxID=330526 RepID=A0AAE0NHY8_9PEZI|nr:hypothetical protein B0H63DRAFT_561393 [Podospora didyma]
MAAIIRLPFEMLSAIIWDDCLERDDVEAVRLACRALSDVAAPRLFYRIYISNLVANRDDFLSICQSPHLACHVREIEWHEISWDADLFTSRISIVHPEDVGIAEDLPKHLHEDARRIFWLRNTPAVLVAPVPEDLNDVYYIGSERQNAVTNFGNKFQLIVDALPNLHTFVSRPMTSSRILVDSGYRMDAHLFQAFQGPRLDLSEHEVEPQTNDGLFLFLFPAMNRPTSTIRRLRWIDEFPGRTPLRPFPPATFQGLESIELCFEQHVWRADAYGPSLAPSFILPADSVAENISTLEQALIYATPTLRHFKLREKRRLTSPQRALQSLSHTSVAASPDDLFHILKDVTSEGDTAVTCELVRKLARLPGIKLETMQIVSGEHGRSVKEVDLIRYVNSSGPDERAAAKPRWMSAGTDIRTSRRCHCTRSTVDFAYDTDSDDDGSSVSSAQSRTSAPRWRWGRFFHNSFWGEVFRWQVPESDPKGVCTEFWKLTSRDGEVFCGTESLEFFEDWSPEDGDLEEATP